MIVEQRGELCLKFIQKEGGDNLGNSAHLIFKTSMAQFNIIYRKFSESTFCSGK